MAGRVGTTAHRWRVTVTAAVVCLAVAVAPAQASVRVAPPVLPNGGFESGTLAQWQTSNRDSSEGGWFAEDGNRSPLSDFPIAAPPQGEWQAVADQTGPGSHILYRDIAVQSTGLDLALTVWYRNRADRFFTPRRLTHGGDSNQQFRIDLIKPGAGLRSMAADDILVNIYRTRVGDPNRLPPFELHKELSPYVGQTVRLRIAEVDNQFFLNVGVDNVRLVKSGPGCPPRCS